ncbi:MAG: CinA family protein [Rhizobiales bacterium]|jgi:nicotinamide-nucleotide amidase|nr:CinA family protein [Hyphomicrobiales bacterium]MBP9174805.1 CinA family protein [Hyphomicrobiales bacterium]HRA93826.1 CinA family protein [Aestuariivirga sp.]
MNFELRAAALLDKCRASGVKIATAESCTGGMVAALLTTIAGSSDVFDCGFVTYSNEAKIGMLGVSPDTLSEFGAVSRECALAMAHGAIQKSGATLAVSITGIAGPAGGSAEKPVGLVHFACTRRNGTTLHREERFGDIGREGVRRASVEVALDLLEAQLL